MDLDLWQKKTVTLDWAGLRLPFHVAQELFSSHDIDQGTKLLLRSLDLSALPHEPVVLDFGCGYGPLGLALKARLPSSRVVLIDRDALAVAFTEWNARELGFAPGADDLVPHGGLDFASALAPNGYDLILWNVPGKAGEQVLKGLSGDLSHALRPGGMVALVVVNPLADTMRAALQPQTVLTVTDDEQHTAHTVLHAHRDDSGSRDWPRPLAFCRGVFDRPSVELDWRGLTYSFQPVIGLPEYDGPSLVSGLMMEALSSVAEDGPRVDLLLAQGVGQGHATVLAAKMLGPERTMLIDHDLLALEATRRNLTANGVPLGHVGPEHAPLMHKHLTSMSTADLILCRLDAQLSPEQLSVQHERLVDMLTPGGTVIISGPSTSASRFLAVATKAGKLRQRARKRRGGASVATLSRR